MRRRWTGLAGVALLVAVATAKEPAFKDAFWDVSYDADSFEKRPDCGGPSQLLAGTAGGVAVEIVVLEEDTERDAAAWMRELSERWQKEGRSLVAKEGPDARGVLFFTDAGIGGAPRRHAVQVHARGVHGFVEHAVGKAGDDRSLLAALGGVIVGERRGATLAAANAARASGKSPDDPQVMRQAFEEYLTRDHPRPALAAQIADAMLAASPGKYSNDDLFGASLTVGLGFLTKRENAAALVWIGKARERAAKTSKPDSAIGVTLYNLACAHAVGGDKDAAFADLDELVKNGHWQDQAAWAQEDPDFATLREDARWAKLPAPQGR